MNYQKLYDIFNRVYGGKDWKIQKTRKQKATLFAKWLVKEEFLIKNQKGGK